MVRLREIMSCCNKLTIELSEIKVMLGRIEMRQCKGDGVRSINDAEFKVFSQWGEDGIIQYLIDSIPIPNKIFVEFGVQNYQESNTRFLLINDNWNGLILDGCKEFIEYVRKDPIYWRYNLKAENVFVTKQNINNVFRENGMEGDIGLLSIDIDGNDWWIWDAITVINPRIVICEYNSIFGLELKVTTPYREDFVREKYHSSHLVYGASISALNDLAERKGYSLVAGNQAGNNLFFVRNDLMEDSRLVKCSVPEAYRESKFREGRDEMGNLTFASMEERRKQIEGVLVYDLSAEDLCPFNAEMLGGGNRELIGSGKISALYGFREVAA